MTASPEEAVATATETVNFVATVENATGNPTYKWEYSRDGGQTWAETSLPGYRTNTLKVGAVDGRLTMYYRCVVTVDGKNYESNAVHFVRPAGIFTIDGVTYERLTETTVKVSGFNSMTATSVTIPMQVVNPADSQSYTVTEIGESAFEGKNSIVEVTLPNSIQIIRAKAFKGCTSLSKMTAQ